ncbi:uncharacterized protein TRIREDRAFT_107577 [Trichoderma reesei QM6a]|uniref:Predicted protein n=1 Tax=Hypocrea jecorina (strain QM6a) TaxID=431241 RepID=G0RJ41_HYPJQ|nr:uncharacterized protein TRIREDRAFT_107577 [Trichoderma reesei QM6a]EGR48837.1 predicted protein [Trichoderma reesei QM6a]
MAKSSRSSSKKFNNQRKAASIFGPAETARQERLSAKLLELAKQAKPEPAEMKIDAMDVDSKKPTRPQITKKRIEKKRKKSSITFPKYSDRLAARKKKNAPKKA